MRSRELIISSAVVASGLAAGLGFNEYKTLQESEFIQEKNSRIDKCIEDLSQKCLTAAGVELQLTYDDLSFESGEVMVDPEYFKRELEAKRPDPINKANRRVSFGLSGALLGGLAASTLIYRRKISNYVSKSIFGKETDLPEGSSSESDIFGPSS